VAPAEPLADAFSGEAIVAAFRAGAAVGAISRSGAAAAGARAPRVGDATAEGAALTADEGAALPARRIARKATS
jgi:hypothetical protein